MELVALERFNMHDPGHIFKAKKEDAEKWIGMGLAREATEEDKKQPEDEGKGTEGPPENKAKKEPAKQK